MEKEIIEVLDEFAETAIQSDFGDGEWTKGIKNLLAKNTNFYFSPRSHAPAWERILPHLLHKNL